MVARKEAGNRPRVPLSRDRVLESAIRLADEAGIDSLSMRKLASELGVEAMSLYNHVDNKGDLVDAIVDLVVEEIELPSLSEPWDVAIRRCAISAHETYLRHPWACPLVMSPSISGSVAWPRLRYIESLLGNLQRGGFASEIIYHGYHAIDSHILGFTMWKLGHAVGGDENIEEFAYAFMRDMASEYPHLVEHARQHFLEPPGDGRDEFEFGLDLIIDGLRRARVVTQ
jgi:AcrR family transcriptional regulator